LNAPRSVLILQTLGNPAVFSPSNALLTLARHLDRRRYEMTVAVPREGLLTAALRDAGAATALVPGLRTYRRHDALWRLPLVAFRVAQIARRVRAAAIVANHAELAPFARAAARLAGLPWIGMLRQADRPSKYYRKYGVGRADAVGAVSAAALATWRAALAASGAVEPPSAVVPTGIDLPAIAAPGEPGVVRDALGLERSDRVVGIVGLRGVKRADRLVRVLGRLAGEKPELKGLFVGGIDDAVRIRFQEIAAACGAEGRVRFAGQQRDMGPYYRAMDIYAHTSDSEGLPKTVLEAMAHALPVVAFRVGGIPEAVVDGATGFLCAPADETEFADRLSRLLADPDLRARLGRGGREAIERRFSPGAMSRGMMDLFDRAIGRM